MMISEHAHGQFMVTLDPTETDQLTTLIEGQQATEEHSPCCALLAEHIVKLLGPKPQMPEVREGEAYG